MNTTAGSSAPHVQALAYLPPETQAWLYRRDDERVQALAELAQAKAQVEQRKATLAANGKRAGKVKASRTHRAIVAMIWRHRRQIRHWPKGKLEARALFIRSHIEGAIELSGSDPKMWMELREPPAWRTIDKVLKSLGF